MMLNLIARDKLQIRKEITVNFPEISKPGGKTSDPEVGRRT